LKTNSVITSPFRSQADYPAGSLFRLFEDTGISPQKVLVSLPNKSDTMDEISVEGLRHLYESVAFSIADIPHPPETTSHR
jgi:hypothetical protein